MSGSPVNITQLVGVPGAAISTGVLGSADPVDLHTAEMVDVGLLTFDIIMPNSDDGRIEA